jgi:hypothetical protein
MTTKYTHHGEIVEQESPYTPLPPEYLERKRLAAFFRQQHAGEGELKVVSSSIHGNDKKVTILMGLANGNVAMEEARFLSLIDCADLSLRA